MVEFRDIIIDNSVDYIMQRSEFSIYSLVKLLKAKQIRKMATMKQKFSNNKGIRMTKKLQNKGV